MSCLNKHRLENHAVKHHTKSEIKNYKVIKLELSENIKILHQKRISIQLVAIANIPLKQTKSNFHSICALKY